MWGLEEELINVFVWEISTSNSSKWVLCFLGDGRVKE